MAAAGLVIPQRSSAEAPAPTIALAALRVPQTELATADDSEPERTDRERTGDLVLVGGRRSRHTELGILAFATRAT